MTDPVVEISCGRLRGVAEKTAEGFKYCAFKGIPYAEPPIGQLRFKDPVPIGKWSGTRDATEYGPICMQYDYISQVQGTDENCLHLNVYVNSVSNQNARKVVMVWIHGGGFYFGSANDTFYGPDYLVTKDIVLVTVNYRLGVFGFLNLEDELVSGNQGFKDQVMALRWVQDNIKAFGGDPNNVTIFGESAGGAAVHYLSISPLAKGLFHKVISQSGIVFNSWAINDHGKKSAVELCSILGNPLQDSKAIVKFLQTVDCKKLHDAQTALRAKLNSLPFGPGVDSRSPNPFMPVPAEELAEQGVHVPYLVGNNGREGIFFLLDITKEQVMDMVDKNFETVLALGSQNILKRYNLTAQQFRRLYYKSERISVKNIDKYVDIASDLYFVEGTHRFLKIQAKLSSAPTYFYQFNYDPGYSAIKSQVSTPMSGASHFDDISYLFKMSLYDKIGLSHLSKGTRDYKVMEQMTELWTNFAKYGKPTIKTSALIPTHWQPIGDGTVLRYLNIDEDLTMQTTLNIEQKYLSAKSIEA